MVILCSCGRLVVITPRVLKLERLRDRIRHEIPGKPACQQLTLTSDLLSEVDTRAGLAIGSSGCTRLVGTTVFGQEEKISTLLTLVVLHQA